MKELARKNEHRIIKLETQFKIILSFNVAIFLMLLADFFATIFISR